MPQRRNTAPIGSAANIKIVPKKSAVTPSPEYRDLLDSCGPDRHEQATMLISCCISDGVNTDKAIIGTGYRYGFHAGHIAHMLKQHSGNNPALHHWRHEDGIYTLLT